jgi:ribonucleoside-diphosphate reductase subunit M2
MYKPDIINLGGWGLSSKDCQDNYSGSKSTSYLPFYEAWKKQVNYNAKPSSFSVKSICSKTNLKWSPLTKTVSFSDIKPLSPSDTVNCGTSESDNEHDPTVIHHESIPLDLNSTLSNGEEQTDYAERFNLHEERDPQSYRFYMQQVAQRWLADEIFLHKDKDEFNKLNERYKLLIEDLVAFFAPGDGLVCEQVDHLKAETKDFSQRAFLGEQYSIEVVHAKAYKDIITTFFERDVQARIFASVDTLPCVREKAEFIVKYMENKALPLSLRYVAAAVSEGVFFVALFAVIFYIKEKKLLNQFCFLNEQVSKDEKLHRDFDLMMARRGARKGEFTKEQALEIVQEGIKIEMIHIRHILRTPIDDPETDALGGMTIENMDRFISTLADQIMVGLGFESTFTFKMPREIRGDSEASAKWISEQSGDRLLEFSPPWMKGLSMIKKPNFYEVLTGNYSMTSQREQVKIPINWEDLSNLKI